MGLRNAGKPAGLALALVLLGLLAAGSAVAERAAPAPTVTIDSAKFSGTWHEGWFGVWRKRVVHHLGRSDYVWKRVKDGSLTVVGTQSDVAQLEVTLTSSSGAVVSTSKPFSLSARRYAATLRLGRPLPGPYTVTTRVVGSSNTTLNRTQKPVTFPAPPEGVASPATFSSSQRGPSVKILRSRHKAWARFQFLTRPPKTNTVYVEWRRPDWVHICQTSHGWEETCHLQKRISPDGSVSTYLSSGALLQTGNWYCQMTVKHGGKYVIARRTFVRIR